VVGDRWASVATTAGHAHYPARCLTAEELSADPSILKLLFADWEHTR
jgi:hypothetical protein